MGRSKAAAKDAAGAPHINELCVALFSLFGGLAPSLPLPLHSIIPAHGSHLCCAEFVRWGLNDGSAQGPFSIAPHDLATIGH